MRDDRKILLVDSAKQAFAHGGYSGTSISHIVQQAGISRSTFYQYFDNKLHIFQSILDSFLQDLEESVKPITLGPGSLSPLTQIQNNLTRVLSLVLEERDLTHILMQHASSFDPTVQRRFEDFYQQVAGMLQRSLEVGMAMKLVRQCNSRFTAYSIIGAVKEVVFQIISSPRTELSVDELARGLLEFGVGGILAEPSVSRFEANYRGNSVVLSSEPVGR